MNEVEILSDQPFRFEEYEIEKEPDLTKVRWKFFFGFEVYGVKIGIRCNREFAVDQIKQGLPELLPVNLSYISFDEAQHVFSVYFKNKSDYWLKKDDEDGYKFSYKTNKFDNFDSKIRLTVAEFAEDVIFLHAGVVSYKDKAIIIPARSFSGKTTLVAELAKRGLEYYSDEYAVIDSEGFVHPFPKKLSMRGIIDDYRQLDIPVEEMGGKKGEKPIQVGLILISKYIKTAKFKPKLISTGEGIIASIANSVSIRQNPKFVLSVLGKITANAKVVKTNRSEAEKFSALFIPYLDSIGY